MQLLCPCAESFLRDLAVNWVLQQLKASYSLFINMIAALGMVDAFTESFPRIKYESLRFHLLPCENFKSSYRSLEVEA